VGDIHPVSNSRYNLLNIVSKWVVLQSGRAQIHFYGNTTSYASYIEHNGNIMFIGGVWSECLAHAQCHPTHGSGCDVARVYTDSRGAQPNHHAHTCAQRYTSSANRNA
jgi:hypothetical protein